MLFTIYVYAQASAQVSAQATPVKLINSLKSQLSKEVRNTYRTHVEKYIEDQRTEEHKRKYIKTGKYKKKS